MQKKEKGTKEKQKNKLTSQHTNNYKTNIRVFGFMGDMNWENDDERQRAIFNSLSYGTEDVQIKVRVLLSMKRGKVTHTHPEKERERERQRP